MPKNRKELITKIIDNKKRDDLYNFIKERVKNNEQVFFVFPLIEESEKTNFKSVEEEYKIISNKYFSDLNCEILHGKTKKKDKEHIMSEFSLGNIDILFSTTVIEVGIDIPNATIMVIENPERFGLAQLHQLRGRINRGDKQSYCFLLLSDKKLSAKSLERLKVLEENKDGLSIAKKDLEIRGAGEVFSSRQSGFSEIALAKIFSLEEIQIAQEEAQNIMKSDIALNKYPLIKKKVTSFESDYHLE